MTKDYVNKILHIFILLTKNVAVTVFQYHVNPSPMLSLYIYATNLSANLLNRSNWKCRFFFLLMNGKK